MLTNNPSGLTALAYLGRLQGKISSTPSIKRSSAPKPATSLTSNANPNGTASQIQKRYKKADCPGERVKIKREARAAGIEVTQWR